MHWHSLLPEAVFLVAFISSLFSGMAGGGGGFIINPFLIAIGLTPQQTVATSKLASFGLTGGSILAFKDRLFGNKKLTVLAIIVAGLMGVVSSLLIRKIDNQSLQRLMGILTLAMVPMVIRRRRRISSDQPSRTAYVTGTIFLAVIMLLQGILSGGIGSLVSVIYIIFFGTSALDANILKRKSSLILNLVVVFSLLNSGLINYTYGLFGIAGGALGGYAGAHIAIDRGETFAQQVLLIFMVISGVWLLATA